MKIVVDGKDLMQLTATQKKVIANDIPKEILEDDLKRRLIFILLEKYEKCFVRLKKSWEETLEERGYKMLPTNKDEFAELVFSQPDYKDRSKRNKENKT